MFDDIEDKSLRRRIKQHVIGKNHLFFASVQPGFEETLRSELASFGLDVSCDFIEGGVEFIGSLENCFEACIRSRTASRIIMRITSFRSSNFYELERKIRNFPWELYLDFNHSCDFRISSKKSKIYHTGKLEDIFKREIFSFRNPGESEICSSLKNTIFLRNVNDICNVSIDASGESLYKRGVKKLIGPAPLRETLASLILLEANIFNYDTIIDPMCGSGTFSIEAASIFTKNAPNIDRAFPFMLWPSFKEKNFNYIKNKIRESIISQENVTQKIFTSDIDSDALKIAEANIPEFFNKIIKPKRMDFFSIKEPEKNGKCLLVLNPPYGKRLKEKEIEKLYKEIGVKIRKDFSRCGYAIIAPGIENERALSIPYEKKITFMNGGIKSAVLFHHP